MHNVKSNQNFLTENVARAAVAEGHSASTFRSYYNITPEAARILAEDSSDLYLDGIASLSPEVASILSTHVGMVLSLDGLSSINSDVALALSKHRGLLLLNGLESLDRDVAEALATHRGMLIMNEGRCLGTPEASRKNSSDPIMESPANVSSDNAQLLELHQRRRRFIYDENDVAAMFPGEDPSDIKHE